MMENIKEMEDEMTKLYELLAVEPDLRQQANTETKRIKELFGKGTGQLLGQVISFHGVTEDAQELPDEITELATTVKAELDSLAKIFGKYMNVTIQKEVSNAVTTVEVDKFEFLNGMPAPAMLNLESRLEDLKKVYESIPTLDPSERWNFEEGQGCFVSELRIAYRTAKLPKAFVSYEATAEHPAQVETFSEDVPTHRRETIVYSGALTIADKRARIERINALLRFVKKARQRANDILTDSFPISDQIFEYINNS